MDSSTRDRITHAARRVRFLLPICRLKWRLAELLEAEPRTLACDESRDGRTRALLNCLGEIQAALAHPRRVHPGSRVVLQRAVATVILGLLRSLASQPGVARGLGRAPRQGARGASAGKRAAPGPVAAAPNSRGRPRPVSASAVGAQSSRPGSP